jgi:hypothetical protein
MPVETPPPPPPGIEQPAPSTRSTDAPIMDVREQFARKTPQTPEDEARTREFIAGKIEMIRTDRTMSDADKAAAIAQLKAQR